MIIYFLLSIHLQILSVIIAETQYHVIWRWVVEDYYLGYQSQKFPEYGA